MRLRNQKERCGSSHPMTIPSASHLTTTSEGRQLILHLFPSSQSQTSTLKHSKAHIQESRHNQPPPAESLRPKNQKLKCPLQTHPSNPPPPSPSPTASPSPSSNPSALSTAPSSPSLTRNPTSPPSPAPHPPTPSPILPQPNSSTPNSRARGCSSPLIRQLSCAWSMI